MNPAIPTLAVSVVLKEADGITGVEAGEFKSGRENICRKTETAGNMTGFKVYRME